MSTYKLGRRLVGAVLLVALVGAGCGDDAAADPTDDVAPNTDSEPADDVAPNTDSEPADDVADGTDSDPAEAPSDDTDSDEPGRAADGLVDLTNHILTSIDADCSAHAGSYTSMITDLASGQDFEGMLTISATDGTCRFETNQIPNHDTGQDAGFVDTMAENDAVLEVIAAPEVADNPSSLGMGANVIMLNGVKWEAYPAACFDVGDEPIGREAIGCFDDEIDNPWRYNIGSPLNDFGFDTYLAHLQPGGLYHYHSTPTVLYDIDCDGTAVSPVVGYAADGFPVYGPCFEAEDGTIRAAESSYVLFDGVRQNVAGYTTPYVVGNVVSDSYDGQFIGDHNYVEGAGDLDECNGMTVDGQHGYRVTGSYPYVLACYRGTPGANFR